MPKHVSILVSIAVIGLGACDAIRTPWDAETPPARPDPVIPEGAPGPPPPTELVTDPYGEHSEPGETNAPPSDDAERERPTSPPPPPLRPVTFQYHPSGQLIPGTGSGRTDETLYAPDMTFPIRTAPAIPQSMVYRPGGAVGGDQCDASNYVVIWQDNFCEKRSSTRNTPLCPTNRVHQGQDIRVGTASECETLRRTSATERGLHEAVAAEDGIIQHIGTYSVQLKGTETGNIYSYLHLNMARLDVAALQTVAAGDRIGYVSNDFGGTPTTFHLHFEIKAPVEGVGFVHVPPYASLVAAYERRDNGRGEPIETDIVAVASLPVLPDTLEMIE